MAEEPDEMSYSASPGETPCILPYTDDVKRAAGITVIDDVITAADDTTTGNVAPVGDVDDASRVAVDTGTDDASGGEDDKVIENQPSGTGWTYRDERSTYRTGEAGYWVPVPGHPTAEEWVPMETSKVTSSKEVESSCSCGQRCGACIESTLFRICCIPFMACLFCCGPPGWLIIYVILKMRKEQKKKRESCYEQ